MTARRYFVSGAAGVIGRELVAMLEARGDAVLAADLKPRPAAFSKSVVYRQGDLNAMTTDELAAFAPDVFIHLAATFERSTETYAFWEENFWHNVRLSHHLMTIAKDLPSLRRVVFASSYLIYDRALYEFDLEPASPTRLAEDAPVAPRNLTGMAKLAHEIELQFLAGFRGDAFGTVCARIYRGYGCNSRDVISRWIRDLLAGKPIRVYREEGRFDYIYARDTAEGLLRLAESTHTGILNLGTGRARRVSDVVDVLREHFPGMHAISEDSSIRFEASQADTRLLRKTLDWVPTTTLEDAIPQMIAFERRQLASPSPARLHGVLVTSAAAKTSMVEAVRNAARKLHPDIRVVAGDLDANAPARFVADAFWEMPRTTSADLQALLDGCRMHGVGTVVPSRDGELLFWAEHREPFAREGIDVVVSPPESVRNCIDKLAFSAFGQREGLPFIPAAERIDDIGPGPYVVKERFGAGSRSIGIGLDRASALEHARSLESPIFQPLMTGTEISIDAWVARDHRVKGVVLRTRDRVVDGESKVTTTFRNEAIEAEATRILEALQLRGPIVMQAFVDAAGHLHVIECNARFGGASTTAIAAGLDSLFWSLLESHGGDVDDAPFRRISGEVRQLRVQRDILVHDPGV